MYSYYKHSKKLSHKQLRFFAGAGKKKILEKKLNLTNKNSSVGGRILPNLKRKKRKRNPRVERSKGDLEEPQEEELLEYLELEDEEFGEW
jgi:hypothetical protein